MNILVVSDFFPPLNSAGAEKITKILVEKFSKKNKVYLISTNSHIPHGEVRKKSLNGYTHFQIGYKPPKRFQKYLGFYNSMLMKTISQIIDNYSFDVANVHNIHNVISYGVISLLKSKGIKTFFTAHDAVSLCYGKYSNGVMLNSKFEYPNVEYKLDHFQIFKKNWRRLIPFRFYYLRKVLRGVDKIICVSCELEKLFNANKINNTIVIHNGIELKNYSLDLQRKSIKNKLKFDSSTRLILFAARISKEKGLNEALNLIEKINQSNANIKLLCVGLDKKIKNQQNVISYSWLSDQNMEDLLNIVDLTIVPSIYLDPFPTIILESMRFGVPVVVSSYSGGKEAVIDGETGYHVNPFNVNQFSEKCLNLLTDEKLNMTFSKNSISLFKKKYVAELFAEKYLKVFNNEKLL